MMANSEIFLLLIHISHKRAVVYHYVFEMMTYSVLGIPTGEREREWWL